MEYNTQQPKMIIPEYGRNIQGMIEYCCSIKDRDEMTEAQAYVGLRWLLNGRPQAAIPHFQWVLKNGNVEFLEYEVSREIMQGKTALLK